MKLLPWHNPLVVTSFMLRARKGGFFTGTTLYLGLLAMAYIGWHYAHANYDLGKLKAVNPHRAFFLFLYAAQCIFSGIVVLMLAGGAMKNEVMNKTLDFQRIATVSPWDILIGKLLGHSTAAYLLAIAALPVGMFCIVNGVPGVGVLELLLMWLQMLTFLILLGACAIQNTLQVTSTKGTGSSPVFGIAIGIVAMITFQTFVNSSPLSFLADPRRVTLAALVTPITAFCGAQVMDPWNVSFYWFSLKIPCLIFTPIAHLAIAWLILNIMVRRLERLEGTALGKRLGYLFLGVADVIAVGVIASMSINGTVLGAAGMTLDQQLVTFLFVHLVLCIFYYLSLTPRKDLIWAWVWRYRGRRLPILDAAVEDHSLNTFPVLTSLGFGIVGVAALVAYQGGFAWSDLVLEVGTSVLCTLLFWGVLYQAFHLVTSKYGGSVYFLAAFVLIGLPMMIGAIFASQGLRGYQDLGKLMLHLTPMTTFVKWFPGTTPRGDNPAAGVSPYPLALVYVVSAVAIYLLLRRRLAAMIAKVDRTKQAMGVAT